MPTLDVRKPGWHWSQETCFSAAWSNYSKSIKRPPPFSLITKRVYFVSFDAWFLFHANSSGRLSAISTLKNCTRTTTALDFVPCDTHYPIHYKKIELYSFTTNLPTATQYLPYTITPPKPNTDWRLLRYLQLSSTVLTSTGLLSTTIALYQLPSHYLLSTTYYSLLNTT